MWNPDQYERFKTERSQPFWDLVALVAPRPDMRIVDLGCGTGELTRALHEKLGARETLGIDSSATMLAKAQANEPVLRFRNESIETFDESGFDLVFSNAALQWVPDHEMLFPRLAQLGSQLAVQMPANDDHVSHLTAAEVARELGMDVRPNYVLPPERYSQLLYEIGFRKQHVRLQVYGHVLPSTEDVIEWVKGTLLTFYTHDPRFLDRYRERLLQRLGMQRPYFYTYKRLLIWGERGT
ncbi:MAG TPA: methyltransferase domain-containing protein [Thermoanaerobaculia bacterium]|nr:methyltransferase domain-containing protein [Thermoanaerobaculia bacterium]